MLINFSQESLKTSVKCDVISTEGYEVENLLKNTGMGFLAYSCMKPPVNIDFTFICNIKINHIVIWPSVGAQKSTGFRILTKSSSVDEFRTIGSSFLKAEDAGFVIQRRDIDAGSIVKPTNFTTACISIGNKLTVDRISTLRVSIVKTDKTVPAISKIEIWGLISRWNHVELVKEINQLLAKSLEAPFTDQLLILEENNKVEDNKMTTTEVLNIPESFLDPITCNIMQQPVVLPSGKTIDQSTLEKYAKSQSIWGRSLTDPFTGVPFTESTRPVFASTLKARIDKFLTENCNSPEIKSMPRRLGTGSSKAGKNQSISCRGMAKETPLLYLPTHSRSLKANKLPIREHKTPIIAQYSRNLPKNELSNDENNLGSSSTIDDNLENHLRSVMSNLKRFSDENKNSETDESKNICSCCESYNYYYKFPCNHLVCRKILTSSSNLICSNCNIQYKSSQIERINI